MTVEELIRDRIAELAAVTSLVSTRIYLGKLPQSPAYPCVRVQLVDDPRDYHLRGVNGFARARIQVDAFAKEGSGQDPYRQVASVSEAIDGDGTGSGLSGWAGLFGSPAFEVSGCFRIDRSWRYDPQELQVLTMSTDYAVFYRT